MLKAERCEEAEQDIESRVFWRDFNPWPARGLNCNTIFEYTPKPALIKLDWCAPQSKLCVCVSCISVWWYWSQQLISAFTSVVSLAIHTLILWCAKEKITHSYWTGMTLSPIAQINHTKRTFTQTHTHKCSPALESLERNYIINSWKRAIIPQITDISRPLFFLTPPQSVTRHPLSFSVGET